MERINRIVRHPLWIQCMADIEQAEKDRIFCRHNTAHLLDVARLAWIEVLERELPVSRELVYAAALLHDLGRSRQYADGTPHDAAGVELAGKILPDCGFTDAEQLQIAKAISGHRRGEMKSQDDLAGILYRADKASRMCLFCNAREDCNWPDEKKNLTF